MGVCVGVRQRERDKDRRKERQGERERVSTHAFSIEGPYPNICCCCSVTQSCPALSEPMNCSMPGIPVLHHLLELVQTHVHWVNDVIQPSHPLSSPSPLAFSFSQHQGLFLTSQLSATGAQSMGVSVSVLPMNIQVWFPLGLTGLISLLSKGLLRVCAGEHHSSKVSILHHSSIG